MPKVLNKTTDEIPKSAVYIGRPSKWGNPFVIGKDGDRQEVCRKYAEYLDNNPELKQQAQQELKGKDLVCFCSPLYCHGDYLLEISNLKQMTTRTVPLMIPHVALEDGISHLNCYSKGQTQLGRNLSHFAKIGFEHPEYGRFESIECYWYWLKTGKCHNHLKPLFGFKAKEQGRLLTIVDNSKFLTEVEEGIRLKITQNLWLLDEFKKSILPMTHYFVVGHGLDAKIIPLATTAWFEYFYNKLRDELCGYTNGIGRKIILAGSRSITDYAVVCEAILTSGFEIGEIVSGGAKGVDQLGERFAKERNIPLKIFLADWDKEGKRAGVLRNMQMGDYADVLVAVHDGKSPGTKQMIEYISSLKKPSYVMLPKT